MRASILTIGTEILIGQVVDTNSAWLGKALEQLGIEIVEIRSVADDDQIIYNALHDLSKLSDYLIITGGLGPTEDDITKRSIARFLDVDLYFDQEMHDRITDIFKKYNYVIQKSHKQQCYLPEGTKKLFNELGTAPGMWLKKEDLILISLPGVPFEMKNIFSKQVVPLIEERIGSTKLFHRTLLTAGMGESQIEEIIIPIISPLPKNINIAFLPGTRQVRVRVSGKSEDQNQLEKTVLAVAEKIEKVLGEAVFGYDDSNLQESVQRLFNSKNKKLALAESCTGGAIAARIVSVSGSSSYFLGSMVVYSNELKQRLLGVNESTLASEGAVSKQTVLEMLNGVLKNTNSDVGLAVSGIAGPGGGTDQKPVGTIWLAWGDLDNQHTKCLKLTKDRSRNIEYTVSIALNTLRKFLLMQ